MSSTAAPAASASPAHLPTLANCPAIPAASIALDVVDLEASCRFYQVLGFTAVACERPGLRMESRLLTSPWFPSLGLHLRAGFGKRVGGSQPGGLLRISLKVDDLPGMVARLGTQVRWLPNPAAVPTVTPETGAVMFLDPSGYMIELATRPAGLL